MIYRLTLFAFLCLGLPISLLAQIQLVPLPQQTGKVKSAFYARTEQPDSLQADSLFITLPFIEDFSANPGRTPDTLRWEPEGGTHINNEMGDQPPSLNFATFDGFDADGQPYELRDPTQIDITDVLTSRYLDLRPYETEDRLGLSFFWQLQGRGEKPDLRDFLQLQFKDSTDNWVTQWQRQGGDSVASSFRQEALYVEGGQFFHEDFQFRFRAQGRRSGSFDVWNIDYIYLDTGRNIEEVAYLDIAGNRAANDYLRGDYTALPLEHFLADPERWVETDSLKGLVNNLDEVFNVLEYECAILDTVTDRFLGFLRVDSLRDRDTEFIEGRERDRELLAQPKQILIRPRDEEQTRLVIAQEFRVSTGDEADFIPTNDTIRTYNTLDDYYAYDDGTAEFAAGVNQRFGKLAYQYALAEPDELTGVDFYFPSVGEDLVGQTFNFFVWKSLDSAQSNPEDEVLYREEVAFEASKGVNQLTRHFFREPIEVSDTIYIGWEQLGEEFLVAGLDRNTDSGDRIFYNVANRWEQNQAIRGSLLFRPIFADPIVSATEYPFDYEGFRDGWQLIPNPASHHFTVRHPDGQQAERVMVFNLSGQLVEQSHSIPRIKVNHLPEGIYLVRVLTQKGFFTKKLLIQH